MSNSITRTYTFSNGGTADGGQVDSEIQNIVNTVNNADAGTTSWTVVKTGTLQSTTSTVLKGSATNDSASAGNIGEYMESVVSSSASVGASASYWDATSLSLTAGDWDVTGILYFIANSATFSSVDAGAGISTTTGNFSTGLTTGSNFIDANALWPVTFLDGAIVVPAYRISIAITTVIYLKGFLQAFTVATPKYLCRLSARRVR